MSMPLWMWMHSSSLARTTLFFAELPKRALWTRSWSVSTKMGHSLSSGLTTTSTLHGFYFSLKWHRDSFQGTLTHLKCILCFVGLLCLLIFGAYRLIAISRLFTPFLLFLVCACRIIMHMFYSVLFFSSKLRFKFTTVRLRTLKIPEVRTQSSTMCKFVAHAFKAMSW